MLLFRTHHSTYAIEPGLGLILQLPGGSDAGLRPGVWYRVVYDRQPHAGETFFCSVTPRDGGAPYALRTSPVEWVGPEPLVPAYAELAAGAARASALA